MLKKTASPNSKLQTLPAAHQIDLTHISNGITQPLYNHYTALNLC